MSLSQKHAGKVLVPWFNHAEWKHVYDLIYSKTDRNWPAALEVLKIWKHRSTLLSAGVEGTLIILEAMLLNSELGCNESNHILSTCLVRFLNICAASGDKQGTFYKKAKENELPKWLIGIRHDIAHGHQLPSASMLKLSLKFCLNWLKEKYWDVQGDLMTDFVTKEESALIMEDVTLILGSLNCTFRHDDLSGQNVLNLLIHNNMILIECETDDKGNRIIPTSILSVWKTLFQRIYQTGMLQLVHSLFEVTCDITYTFTQRETASLWLKEVFRYKIETDQDETIKIRYKNFATQIVERLNPTTINFVKEVLQYVDAPQQFIQDSVSLIVAFNTQGGLRGNSFFTVNDLLIEDTCDSTKMSEEDRIATSRWIPIKDVSAFTNLPIGVLPHQDRLMNPLFAV